MEEVQYTAIEEETKKKKIDQYVLQKSKDLFTHHLFSIFFPFMGQLLIIISIILIFEQIYTFLYKKGESVTLFSFLVSLGFEASIWIISLLLIFTSQVAKDLRNAENSLVRLLSFLDSLYQSAPDIKFRKQQFHYKTDNEGVKFKSVSNTQDVPFIYYSWKDISDRIVLSPEVLNEHCFIKVFVKTEILFADPISYGDYLDKKEQANEIQMEKDAQEEIVEDKGLVNYEVKESEFFQVQKSCFLTSCIMTLFTLITLPLPFFIYLESQTLYIEVIIKKIVSTRYSLIEGKFAEHFKKIHPSYSINNKESTIEIESTQGVIEGYQLPMPTSEQIQNSIQYLSKEEVYKIVQTEQPVTPSDDAILPVTSE